MAGIPVAHPRWKQRRDAIGGRVKDGAYDVVGLQELWFDSDSRALARSSGLPYAARHARSLGPNGGLTILSRFPIVMTHAAAFSCRSPLWKIHEGDAIANKGALMARLRAPSGELDVYNTHLVSDYPRSRYRSVRLAQIFELSELVRRLSGKRPVLLLGDFNAAPDSEEYRVLADLLGLKDLCLEAGRDRCGPTYRDARIDHIFTSAASPAAAAARAAPAENEGALSDHRAVEAFVPPSALRPLWPQAPGRLEALRLIEERLGAMSRSMGERSMRRSWIPLYGILHQSWYRREILRMDALKERVISERIRAQRLRRELRRERR